MTRQRHWTLEDSGIEWPPLSNHIPCMAHVIELALGAFMSSLGVKGRTKSWEAHECNKQFGKNQSMDNGKSHRLREEGNTRINKVSAMRLCFAKIIGKVCTSWYFECPETDGHKAQNAWCIDYANTWSSKWVHWLSTCQILHHSTTVYGYEDTLQLNIWVTWASIPITRIHLQEDP